MMVARLGQRRHQLRRDADAGALGMQLKNADRAEQ